VCRVVRADDYIYGIPFNARRVPVKFNPVNKSLISIGPDFDAGSPCW
jgi:hypothetical protein